MIQVNKDTTHTSMLEINEKYIKCISDFNNLNKIKRKFISKLEKLISMIIDLTILKPTLNGNLKIYFPIHLDVSLRNYN